MRMWAQVLLLAGLACGALVAQEFPMSPVPAADRAEVSGTVLDAATGQPLAHAWVDMLGLSGLPTGPFSSLIPGQYQTSTDSRGHFILVQLYPGQYVLSIGRFGYVTQKYGQQGDVRPPGRLTVQAGARMNDLLIRLIPTGTITGRVTDKNGDPMQWGTVSVNALRIRYDSDGNKQMVVGAPSAPAWGRGPGEYRLRGLAPGTYYVAVSYRPLPLRGVRGPVWPRYVPKKDRIPKTPKNPNFAYPPMLFYPGTRKLSAAKQVTVAAGQKISGIDFVIRGQRAYHVSGRVTALTGAKPGTAAKMINVTLRPDSPYFRGFYLPYRKFIRSGSPFDIRGVLPGHYILWASQLAGRNWAVARAPVEVINGDVRGLNLVIRPTISLTGRLRVEGRDALPAGRFLISLTPVEHGPFGFVNAQLHGDGTFVVNGLNPGPYRLRVGLPKGAYVKSVHFGTRDALTRPIVIRRGAASDSLSVVVGLDGAGIGGTVLTANHRPAAGAVVVLIPDGSLRGARVLSKTTGADQHGRFILSGIRPGIYELFAWEDVESGAWLNSDFLRQFEGTGQEIELGAGERKTVQIQEIPGS